MKYTSIPILLFLLIGISTQAQVKLPMSSGILEINSVNRITIQGHSGSEVLIEREGDHHDKGDERAEGLREINARGLVDNTGIGLVTIKNGNNMEISQLSRNNSSGYIFKIPSGVAVSYEHSTHHAKTVSIENTSNEIEVSANFNNVEISNANGPLAISTVHGHIDADFTKSSLKNDIKLYSTHGHVDVTVPSSIKADFRLKTSHGKMYTDLDFQVDRDGDLVEVSSRNITGKTNGGGINFALTAVHNNIYLRKK